MELWGKLGTYTSVLIYTEEAVACGWFIGTIEIRTNLDLSLSSEHIIHSIYKRDTKYLVLARRIKFTVHLQNYKSSDSQGSLRHYVWTGECILGGAGEVTDRFAREACSRRPSSSCFSSCSFRTRSSLVLWYTGSLIHRKRRNAHSSIQLYFSTRAIFIKILEILQMFYILVVAYWDSICNTDSSMAWCIAYWRPASELADNLYQIDKEDSDKVVIGCWCMTRERLFFVSLALAFFHVHCTYVIL